MASNAAAVTGNASAFRPASHALTVIGLSLATFMQILDLTIANVSLPTIAGNLGASQDQSTWVITSYMVANAIALPLTGFITRRFGEVKPFVWATVLFSLCSFMCGLSTSLGMLVLFRAIQGAMAGPMYPITQSLMVSLYPDHKRGTALGILSMIAVTGPIVGPILGGWLTQSYSWHWIFLINVPLGLFAAAVVYGQMHGRPEHIDNPRLDVVGLVTLIIGVGSLQILLDKGNELDWFQSNFIVVLAIVAAIALTVFLVWELTDHEPIVNLRLFKHRNFAAGTLALVLGYSIFFSTMLLVQLWMQNTLGYTAFWAGLASAPMGLFPVLLSMLIGKYMGRFDLRWLTTFSFFVIGMCCFMYAGFNTQVNFGHVAIVPLVEGLGMAFFFLPVLTVVLSPLSGREVSAGSGLATFLRTIGGSFGVSIVTYLWERGGAVHHANLAEHINAYSAQVRDTIAVAGRHAQRLFVEINGEITRQASQLSLNHMFVVLGALFMSLIVVVWLARPPFIKTKAPAAAGAD